jgi:hypothetical protein
VDNSGKQAEATGGKAKTPAAPPSGLDDVAILARFVAGPEDAPGLIAYALHRKALMAFRDGFRTHHGRDAGDGDEAAFLIGEISEARLEAYRKAAAALIPEASSAAAPPPQPKRRTRWPWFGMWVDAPLGPAGDPDRINWRGLFGRLFVLLLAVVVTALLLRLLFVKT